MAMSGDAPFLFLHIPRTAGTTLNRLLARHFPPETLLSLYSREEFSRYATIDADHLARLRLIQGHVLLGDYERFTFYDAPVRAFTFLREPVSRVISEYYFLRTWPKQHLYALLNDQNISLAEYVDSAHKLLRYKGSNFMTRVLSGIDPDHSPEEALARAKTHLRDRFVVFGLTEAFDASLLLLADALGLQDLLYERQNALRQPPSNRATDAERELVASRNCLDTALFGFAQALFAERVAAKGPAFAARLSRFKHLLGKYQKVCGLLETRSGMVAGEICKPKE
jgi:hypothetical protein